MPGHGTLHIVAGCFLLPKWRVELGTCKNSYVCYNIRYDVK